MANKIKVEVPNNPLTVPLNVLQGGTAFMLGTGYFVRVFDGSHFSSIPVLNLKTWMVTHLPLNIRVAPVDATLTLK